MTVTAAAAVIAALLSTIITAIAVQAHWSAQTKRLVAGAIAVILGTAVAIATNQLGDAVPAEWSSAAARWIVIVGGVAAAAQAFYLQWKGILSKLEDATTITPATTDQAVEDPAVVVTSQPADTQADQVAEDTSGVPPDQET